MTAASCALAKEYNLGRQQAVQIKRGKNAVFAAAPWSKEGRL
jgi:hypothetical protein